MFIIMHGIPEEFDERNKKLMYHYNLEKTKLLMPNVTIKLIPFALGHLELSQFIQCRISYFCY